MTDKDVEAFEEWWKEFRNQPIEIHINIDRDTETPKEIELEGALPTVSTMEWGKDSFFKCYQAALDRAKERERELVSKLEGIAENLALPILDFVHEGGLRGKYTRQQYLAASELYSVICNNKALKKHESLVGNTGGAVNC